MDINNATKSELLQDLRVAEYGEKIDCNQIIIVPNKRHSSGYRGMMFILCKNSKPLCLLKGNSDVLHLTDYYKNKDARAKIDCLYKSKLIRVMFYNTITINADYCSDLMISLKEDKE